MDDVLGDHLQLHGLSDGTCKLVDSRVPSGAASSTFHSFPVTQYSTASSGGRIWWKRPRSPSEQDQEEAEGIAVQLSSASSRRGRGRRSRRPPRSGWRRRTSSETPMSTAMMTAKKTEKASAKKKRWSTERASSEADVGKERAFGVMASAASPRRVRPALRRSITATNAARPRRFNAAPALRYG